MCPCPLASRCQPPTGRHVANRCRTGRHGGGAAANTAIFGIGLSGIWATISGLHPVRTAGADCVRRRTGCRADEAAFRIAAEPRMDLRRSGPRTDHRGAPRPAAPDLPAERDRWRVPGYRGGGAQRGTRCHAGPGRDGAEPLPAVGALPAWTVVHLHGSRTGGGNDGWPERRLAGKRPVVGNTATISRRLHCGTTTTPWRSPP